MRSADLPTEEAGMGPLFDEISTRWGGSALCILWLTVINETSKSSTLTSTIGILAEAMIVVVPYRPKQAESISACTKPATQRPVLLITQHKGHPFDPKRSSRVAKAAEAWAVGDRDVHDENEHPKMQKDRLGGVVARSLQAGPCTETYF